MAVILVVSAPLAAEAVTSLPSPTSADYVPGEVIVRVKDATPEEIVAQVAATVDATITQTIAPDTYLLSFDEKTPVLVVIAQLTSRPEVQYAEPNYRVQAF